MHADRLHVGVETILSRTRHAILTHKDDQVGAHQRIRRHARRQPVVVAKVTARGTRGDHRNVLFFSRHLQGFPPLALEDALSRHDHRALSPGDHVDRLRHILVGRLRPRFGAVFGFVVVILQVGRIGEARSVHFLREVQVDRARHSGLELTKGVSPILMDPVGSNQPLSPLLHSLRSRLLVAELPVRLAVLPGDCHIAGQDEQGRAGCMRAGNSHDHLSKSGAFGTRSGHHLAGNSRVAVGRAAHHPLAPASIAGNARRGNCADDRIIARAAEQGRQILFLAKPRENLGASHAFAGEFPQPGTLAHRLRDFLGSRNRRRNHGS